MSRPGVLLDRDGTIIRDTGYVGSVDRVEFLEGAAEAIARLNRAGLPVAVVTNQAGVARGFYTVEDVHQVHKHMIEELDRFGAHVDAWLFCPYHPDGTVDTYSRSSQDRKPAPGMALAAAERLDLDLRRSWVIGDSPADVGLARAVGARALRVAASQTPSIDVDSFPDLAGAVDLVLTEHAAHAFDGAVTFPARLFDDAGAYADGYGAELVRAMSSVDRAALTRAAELLNRAHDRGASVFACGNGGSASIANHLQCDHVKGVRNGTDLPARVFSLSTNMEIVSAIANDHGYEHVFEFQLQSMARPGDVLVVISSGGRSPNVVRAIEWANANGIATIAMTGFTGGRSRELATVAIHVESDNYGIVEDAHQACMHLLAQFVRQSRMTPHDIMTAIF